MTDLEMTRLGAEAMEKASIHIADIHGRMPVQADKGYIWSDAGRYDPLHDDAQAMALVKKFDLHIGKTLRTPESPRGEWFVSRTDKYEVDGTDLNRAIVECVAKIQAASPKAGEQ